jgi:hypothetical protein
MEVFGGSSGLSEFLLQPATKGAAMTGANTERIVVPVHEQVSALILHLTPGLFTQATEGQDEPDIEGNHALDHWFNLRHLVASIGTHRSIVFHPSDSEKLRAALDFAHEHAHEFGMSVEACPCRTASIIRQIRLLLAKEVVAA